MTREGETVPELDQVDWGDIEATRGAGLNGNVIKD